MKAPSYKWTCNACKKTVDSGLGFCSNCGCPAGANVIDTERFKDKKSWLMLVNKRSFEKLMFATIMGPMFIFLTAFNNQTLITFISVITLGLTLFLNIRHIKKAFVITSYNFVIILYSVGNLTFMVSRVTFIESSSAILAFSVFEFVGLCYLFLGKAGKKVREAYCLSVGGV